MAKKTLLAIEGLDGSGKATQAKLLAKTLAQEGIAVREVSFPDYGSDSSALVKMYLSGQFGSDPQDVNAYAASSFFAVDRFASFKRDWCRDYERGIIIADRYTTSNAIHQCSKLPRQQWEPFLEWLFDFEYGKLGIPSPDLVIYLSVDPMVSQQLMTRRYSGDESKKAAAHYGWTVIRCVRDGAMRSIEDIHREIQGLLQEAILKNKEE